MSYILYYFILITLITFLTFGYDKSCAKNHRWRVPEKTLFFLALAGGSPGALSGMYFFHHKTQKPIFKWGIPAIMVIQIILGGFMWIFL